MGRMTSHIWNGNKNVWNHQPVMKSLGLLSPKMWDEKPWWNYSNIFKSDKTYIFTSWPSPKHWKNWAFQGTELKSRRGTGMNSLHRHKTPDAGSRQACQHVESSPLHQSFANSPYHASWCGSITKQSQSGDFHNVVNCVKGVLGLKETLVMVSFHRQAIESAVQLQHPCIPYQSVLKGPAFRSVGYVYATSFPWLRRLWATGHGSGEKGSDWMSWVHGRSLEGNDSFHSNSALVEWTGEPPNHL